MRRRPMRAVEQPLLPRFKSTRFEVLENGLIFGWQFDVVVASWCEESRSGKLHRAPVELDDECHVILMEHLSAALFVEALLSTYAWLLL